MNRNFVIPKNESDQVNMSLVKKTYKDFFEGKEYAKAIKYLNFIKNQGDLTKYDDILKLHDLYIEVLLEIEDYQSLLNILKSKMKYIDNHKDKNLHGFYMAIAYEGLSNYQKAIDALQAVEDTLSNQNMINKYLKLSLLYLKVNQEEDAIQAFRHAKNFDRHKSHEMFLYVESELAFIREDYQQALSYYEDFFIKTKRKLSYLHTYIKIAMAMNLMSEAYEFYLSYKERVINQAQIQAKISFYQAVIPLLKSVNQDEYMDVLKRLNDIKTREIISFDNFNVYQFLFNHLNNELVYDKEREVIRQQLIDMNLSSLFLKLSLIKIEHDELSILHLSKTLLLEKKIANDSYISKSLINQDIKDTYSHDEIQDFVFVGEKTDYIFVEKVDSGQYLLGHVQKENFDLAKKMMILSAKLLKNSLMNFHLLNQNKNHYQASISLLNQKAIGFCMIKNNTIHFLNDFSKKIFSSQKDFIDFSDFQKQLEENIYLDDFTSQKQISITCNGKTLYIQSLTIDFSIYLLVEEEKEIVEDSKWLSHENHAIALINIENYQMMIDQMTYKNYCDVYDSLMNDLPDISNQHMIDCFTEAKHMIFILLDSRDKRIVQSIYNKMRKSLPRSFDLRIVANHFNQSFDKEVEKLFKKLNLTSKQSPILISDKILRTSEEKEKLYLTSLQKILNDKEMLLNYLPIKDWQKEKVQMIEVAFDDMSVLNDKPLLNQVLKEHNLHHLFDRTLINQVIKKDEQMNGLVQWLIPVSIQSIESKKAFNYLLRRISLLKSKQVSLLLDMDAYFRLSSDDQNYLKEKSISLAIKMDKFNLDMLRQLKDLDYIIINYHIYQDEYFNHILPIIKTKFNHIIYDHDKQKLSKKELSHYNIYLIKGAYAKT
jgi:hypothetical protein